MRGGYDPVGREIDLRLFGGLPNLVFGAYEHRNDEASPGRLDGPHEGVPVAGVRNGAGDRIIALAALDELREGITVAKLQSGRLDDVEDLALGGGLHRHRPGHEFLSILVDTAAVEDDEISLLLLAGGHLCRQGVPRGDVPAEMQIPVHDPRPRAWQPHTEQERNDGFGAGGFRFPGFHPDIHGFRPFDVESIHVTRHDGGHVDLLLLQGHGQLCRSAHLYFVEGDIGQFPGFLVKGDIGQFLGFHDSSCLEHKLLSSIRRSNRCVLD